MLLCRPDRLAGEKEAHCFRDLPRERYCDVVVVTVVGGGGWWWRWWMVGGGGGGCGGCGGGVFVGRTRKRELHFRLVVVAPNGWMA